MISHRLSTIKPSATLAVTEAAAGMRAKGIPVIDLGAGEPDFETPPHIRAAAAQAMECGHTKYTPVGGTLALKHAIVEKLHRDNHFEYETREVMASCGGKHALYLAMHAILNPGDEILVPGPYWVSYSAMAVLAGAQARIVYPDAAREFRLTPEQLEESISPTTRAIVLNAPSNPVGVTYDADTLAALGEVIARHDLQVVCDDVYEMMVYEGVERTHLLQVRPDLRERTVVVNSVSKAYAMTGWRLGYTAAPWLVIEAMSTLQGQMTSNPSSIAQAAAAEALSGPQDSIAEMMREFQQRRDLVLERLSAIPGIVCVRPRGAFYAFPNVGAYLRPGGSISTGDQLAQYLLESAHVAVVGGSDFGYPEHIRISYATSRSILEEGLGRIATALATLGAVSSYQ